MGFVAGQPVPFTVTPDWSEPVRETLAWRTEVLRAPATGVSFHRSLRPTPARSFEAFFTDDGADSRLAEQLLRAKGGQEFLLPIWPDVMVLGAQSAGAASIACTTAGRDFVAGGKALLLWRINEWEVVQTDTVAPGSLGLHSVLANSWPAGVRLYPLRRARARTGGQEVRRNAVVSARTLAFDVSEACDWPAVLPPTTYLGWPVLERRNNDGEQDATSTYERLLASVDNSLGEPAVFDLAGVALGTVQLAWGLLGRQERTDLRSLLYALRGGALPVWVPSFKQDLVVVAPIAAAATTISVEWSGYVPLEALAPNRRDVRIELFDGTVFHRRITGTAEVGATETLAINTALGQDVAPSAIRCVCFMVLATASDVVGIEHLNDLEGAARVRVGFSTVVPDV